jgi:hypothetical protein
MSEEQNIDQEQTEYRGAATDAKLALDAATFALLAAPKVKQVYDKLTSPKASEIVRPTGFTHPDD